MIGDYHVRFGEHGSREFFDLFARQTTSEQQLSLLHNSVNEMGIVLDIVGMVGIVLDDEFTMGIMSHSMSMSLTCAIEMFNAND